MFVRWVEEPHGTSGKSLLEVLQDNGVGCIPFSPLAQGMLSDRYLSGIPEGSRASKSWGFLKSNEITEQKLTAIRDLNDIAKKRKQSLAQMALSWLLKDSRVTSVLIGVSSVEQLQNNLGCLDNLTYNEEELKKIEKILKSAA
jgi:L-glyceraldehyde 3-phosphate reductase